MVTAGLSGLLYSSVELGRRLRVAGHRVTYVGPIAARELVEHHGLDFLELDPGRYQQFLKMDAAAGKLSRMLNLRRRRIEAARSLELDAFVDAVRDLDPHLVLIDGEMHEHIITLSPGGVPTVLLNTFVSIWRQPGLPPPHHFVRPGVGWKGSPTGISALWLALRWRKWRTAAVQAVRRMGCDRLSILGYLAREAGFDLGRETDNSQWLIPFTYREFPVLSLHALEFEFPHRPPERVHYLGPMVLESRIDRPLTDRSRLELEAIFERRRSSGGETKLIYAGFGSVFSTDLGLLRRLMGVVAERPEWELIISLSDRFSPADVGSVPARVHLFPWVPQIRVLQEADAMVTHGGINTLDECVISGVPVLVYCGDETEMAGSTARAVHHGIGIAGNRSRDSTEVMRAHLDCLLNEPRFADNLQRLQGLYADYVENLVAERVVESLLSQGATAAARRGSNGASP